jgi:hypothetical protein
MSGFEPKPKLYRLLWEDGDYEGLEVTAKGVSTEAYFEISGQAESMSDPPKSGEVKALLQRFGRLLVEWNVTEGGKPVKPGFEGLASLDIDLSLEMFARWSAAVGGADPTSRPGSKPGATPAELKLAAASRSLAS